MWSSSDFSFLLQVLSLFTVVASTATCLYFVDTSGVANKTGLRTAGILVLLLNAFFLLLMVVLIIRAGSADAWEFAQKMWDKTKLVFGRVCGCCMRRRQSTFDASGENRVRVAHRPSTERLVGGVQLSNQMSTQLSHRGSSLELLRNTVFSRSGTVVENGDSAGVRYH